MKTSDLALYWATSRVVVVLAASVLALAIATQDVARIILAVATAKIMVVGVLLVRRQRRAWFLSEPETVGSRVGFIFLAADSFVLLSMALLLPYFNIGGLGQLYSIYPLAPIVKAVALLAVAHVWVRARRQRDTSSLAEFLHPVIVIAVSLATWFLVDQIIPSGWGEAQAWLAAAIAVAALLIVLTVCIATEKLAQHFRLFDLLINPRTCGPGSSYASEATSPGH